MIYLLAILGILLGMLVYLGIHIVKLIQLYFDKIKRKGAVIIFVCYIIIVVGIFFISIFYGFNGNILVENISYGILLAFFYSICFYIVYDIIRLSTFLIKGRFNKFITSKKVKKTCSIAILCTGMMISIYGYIHARHIIVKNYSISIDKTMEQTSLNAIIISDLHLGAAIGEDEIKKLVEKINLLEPDIVFIAGDIFNNEYDELKNHDEVSALFKTINSVYGVYACLGNHDIDGTSIRDINGNRYRSFERIAEFLKESEIILLDDEAVLVADSFYVAGRKDSIVYNGYTKRSSLDELLSGIDMNKPIFLLDHRPEAVEEASAYGVDLIMCGHTHNGQIFPGNIVIALTNKYGHGYYKNNATNIFVTSGVGYWGTAFRIGSDSEIVQVKIQFNEGNEGEQQ